ncbi:MAG: hypothetical protein ACXVBE_03145 [Bdellovibrionota bacterium]
MKNWAVLLLTALISLPALAVEGGHSEGNGGGGVIREGRAMTFYSAGLITELDEEAAEDIPGLNELVQRLYKMPYFTKKNSVELITALRPTAERKYYRVMEKYFNSTTEARIREEYVRAMGITRPEVALFAITDSNSKNTYLLPSFYKLKPVEQMAILFHEAYWVRKPDSKYSEIISAEAKMQAYLETGDPKKLLKLISVIGSRMDYIKAAMAMDAESGALKPLLDKNGNIPMATLLGKETLNCIRQDEVDFDCRDNFKFNLIELSMQNPGSLLLPALSQQLELNKANLAITSKFDYENDLKFGIRTKLYFHHDEETYYGSNSSTVCDRGNFKAAAFPLKIDETLGAFVSKEVSIRTAPKLKEVPKDQRILFQNYGYFNDPGACSRESYLLIIENKSILGEDDGRNSEFRFR